MTEPTSQRSLLNDAEETGLRARQRAEIHRRLNEVAPPPPDAEPLTASALALFLAREAQITWTQHIRNRWGTDDPLSAEATRLLRAQYAAAHAIHVVAEAANSLALLPNQIRDAWEDGAIGARLSKILGNETAQEISDLATKLQALDAEETLAGQKAPDATT